MTNLAFLSKNQLLNSETSKHPRKLLRMGILLSLSVFALSACSKKAEVKELPRPVRAMEAKFTAVDVVAELSGDVRARVESRLGFRVPGKIMQRKVDVGSVVTKGQVLMQLDPQDLVLTRSQAQANLGAAESQRDLAKAELKRYQDLKDKQFVSGSVLESKETSYKAAQASYAQAFAALQIQTNQAGYSQLIADVDGVITSIDAEVGQVVAAGTLVVKIAKSGEMEVVVGVPEDKVNSIANLKDVQVRLWANSQLSFPAQLRELAPMADPVTRTYTAKVTLPKAVEGVRLGMTATVSFAKSNVATAIRLPLTALYKDKNQTSVWVVENQVVRLVPVQIASTLDQDVLIGSGLQAGQMVVTAGVHFLQPGQKVNVLGQAPSAAQAAAASASVSSAVPATPAAPVNNGAAK